MKHLKIRKFPFKNVIVLAIECKMYLKIQQKLHHLGCISKHTMRSVEKKTRLNSSKDDFLMKSFPSSIKRKLSILLNFLFSFFVFNDRFIAKRKSRWPCDSCVIHARRDYKPRGSALHEEK